MDQLDLATRHAMLAALATAIRVDGGPTREQQHLLRALGRHLFGVTDAPGVLEPAAAAAALPDPRDRHLLAAALVVFELARHPASAELTHRVDAYLAALGDGEDLQALARDYVVDARAQVAADWARIQDPKAVEAGLGEADPSVVARRLEALADLPAGTAGRSFADFYARHGFTIPPDPPSLTSHDFAHVLAGYEPTPEGEIALQAMLLVASGGTRHLAGLLASLLLFEVGMLPFNDAEPKVAVLDRPGAVELFADALVRGASCGRDFQDVDHLALASRPLAEVRAELGIPVPEPGPFTFVV